MRIFLIIIFLSFTLSLFGQNQKGCTDSLLTLEYFIWKTDNQIARDSFVWQKAILLHENGLFDESNKELLRLSLLDNNRRHFRAYHTALNHFLSSRPELAYNHLLEIPDSIRGHHFKYLELWLFILNEQNRHMECRSKMLRYCDADDCMYHEVFMLPESPDYISPEKVQMRSSILPGLGQFFEGSIRMGLESLFTNTLFVIASIKFVASGYYMGGLVYGLIPAIRFYLGGRENIFHQCSNRNQQEMIQLRQKYAEQIVSFGDYLKMKGYPD